VNDYEVFDSNRRVVGRIMLHPQAPKDLPWFWTITAREIPPSVHNRGYSATREQAMADFKTRWLASIN
jgi:alkylated DNA nucleotide flippase Atl1